METSEIEQALQKKENDILNSFIHVFGQTTFNDIQRVYTSVWGVEAYRTVGELFQHNESFDTIISFLLELHDSNSSNKKISLLLSQYLRYCYGTTTSGNKLRCINIDMLQSIVALWRNKLTTIGGITNETTIPLDLKLVWAEWILYTEFIKNGQTLSGCFTTDSYEQKKEHTEIEQQIHDEYEKADVIGLGVNFCLMRISVTEIIQDFDKGNLLKHIINGVKALLYGEGRYYQNLLMVLELTENLELQKAFQSLIELIHTNFQVKYREARKIDDITILKIDNNINVFLQSFGEIKINSINIADSTLKYRQKLLRNAEDYLLSLEKTYATFKQQSKVVNIDPISLYSDAMNKIVDFIDQTNIDKTTLEATLINCRNILIQARYNADSKYSHNYYYWVGYGDEIGQTKSRSLHPRVKLYFMEAYAERIYYSALLTLNELQENQTVSIKSVYTKFFELDERTIYLQEWIGNYGARRTHIFGFSPITTVECNNPIIALDKWVLNTRNKLIEKGLTSELWGYLATGYTERLRFLLKPGTGFTQLGIDQLQDLLNKEEFSTFAEIVRTVNPYDQRETIDNVENTPLVTAGVHIHNVLPSVFYETMVHLRELDWNPEFRWTLVGTTTSKKELAEQEYLTALKLGITRLGITNRQLLKGGNQNRIMPNIPRSKQQETFYLTIDDDYVVSAQTLYRLAGILLSKPHAIFSQAPLFFRASFEPGHSIGRHCDSTMLLNWSSQVVPSFHESTTILPFGTGTLFRLTEGSNDIEMTGGLVVDPDKILAGEDWAYGVTSMLMRFLPEQFEETKQLPSTEVENRKKRTGYYIAEDWIVGDGVDFAPGSQRQKSRWNETCTRVFKGFWFPHLMKNKKIGELNERTFTIVNYYTLASWLIYLFYPFVFFVFPTTVFFLDDKKNMIQQSHETLLAGSLWIIFLIWFSIRTYLRRPAYRMAGVPFFELFNAGIMFSYGTFWSFCVTSYKTLLTKPQNKWSANKGRTNTIPLLIFHLSLGLYYLFISVYAIKHNSYEYTWYFLLGLFFIYTARFHEHAAKNQKEKIQKIKRDTKFNFINKISEYLAGQTHILGAPISVNSTMLRNTKLILWGEMIYFAGIIIVIRFLDGRNDLSKVIMAIYLIIIGYLVYKRFIIFVYSFKSINKQRTDLGIATQSILLKRFKK